MTKLTITAPTTAGQSWWSGNGTKPDYKTFTIEHPSGVRIFEVECSNASIVVGQAQSAHPAFACDVEGLPPAGWTLIQDHPRPWPSVWYPMHAAVRRFTLYPTSQPSLQQTASLLAHGIYESAWRRGRVAYGPTNCPMPDLSPAQASAAATEVGLWLLRLRTEMTTGGIGGVESTSNGYVDYQEGLVTPAKDGWRPWGPVERYAQAGSGIYFYTGWEQCEDMPAYLWLAASANHERRWHAYDRASGEVITADRYGDPGPKYQEGTGDPNNGWLPEFVGVAAHPDPIILPYDQAHSIRGFRHLLALSEMSNSPMVRRMLKGQAAMFRLQLSEIGPHPSSNYVPPSLRTYLGWAQSHPHTGHLGQDTGRQFGWPATVIAQSVKKGCAENRAWCSMFSLFAETAAMPNGIVSRCHEKDPPPGTTPQQWAQQDVWYDPANDTAHAFEVPIFWHGASGASTYGGRPVPAAMQRAMQSLYEEAPLYPYYGGVGPPMYSYVAARNGAPYASVPGGKNAGQSNSGDSTHVMAGATLAGLISEPKRYIAAVGRITNTQALATKLDLREGAGLLALMQKNP